MNINEILERHNQEDLTYNVRAKQAIKEIVKETLRMAAEDAKVVKSYDKWTFSEDYEVDKDSITNVINKIKF